MLKSTFKMRKETPVFLVRFAFISVLIVASFAPSNQPFVQAQSSTPTATPGEPVAVLTVVLRDSIGNPLEGVTCEVLSYGWGLQINEAFAVIAKGETDKNGVVAFDDSRWPNAGYRFRFTPTDHVKPAGTYFLPDELNQYRGYPGAVVGGKTETQRFVLSGSDSVVYNDISKEGQSPAYKRDPIAGLEKPRTTLMDGKEYIASVVAATSTAEARGEPTPTIPPPPSPSPRPGEIQPALTITPGPVLTHAAGTAGANASVSPKTSAPALIATSAPGNLPTVTPTSAGLAIPTTQVPATRVAIAQSNSTSIPAPGIGTGAGISSTTSSNTVSTANNNNSATNSNNLFVSILLALLGVVCLALFWKFRFSIYPLFGIETVKPNHNRKIRPVGKAGEPNNSQGNQETTRSILQAGSNEETEDEEE